MATYVNCNEDYAIPADLRQRATALMGELAADGRDVCKLMHYHLWLMTSTDTPDAEALAEDVATMRSYLDSKGGQG